MANGGNLLSSGWRSDSYGDTVHLEFAWEVTSTSIENNTKTIYWELRGKRASTSAGYVMAGGFKAVIDGETVFNKSTDYRIELRNGTVIATGTKTIKHNADGTRSFSVSIQGAIYVYAVNVTGSKTFTLDTIPRASAINCTTANIESKPTITISRASSSFTHTVTYQFGNRSGTIATKTDATSITNWQIPYWFYNEIPNAKTGKGTLTCTTYSGNTVIGTSSCELPVTTDETICKPTVSGTVVDSNASTVALTGDSDILVRYCSTALCTMGVTLNKEAGSVKSKTINNVAISGATREIANVETGAFDFWAKDSREYASSTKVVKTIVQYEKLTSNVTVQRTDPTSGRATLKIEGNYFNGNFGVASNALTVRYRIDNGEYTTVTPHISGNKHTATISLSDLDYTKAFAFEVVVSDKIATVTKAVTLPKGIPVFDWGEDDFNFNVPVKISDSLTIGSKTITEEQLTKLLALIK